MIGAITAPLTLATCSACGGDGGWVDEQGAIMCFTCCGTGETEICSACNTVPEVKHGFEVCGCLSDEIEWAMKFTDWLEAA